jgi:ribonuclease HII
MTTFLIGVDEAGYGPNLGPLVVAATVWQLDDALGPLPEAPSSSNRQPLDLTRTNWYARLSDRVSLCADENRVAVADSKAIYSPAAGLTLLEEGVLAALSACGTNPQSYTHLVELLRADPDGSERSLPWHGSWNTALPVAACPLRIARLADRLQQGPASGARTRRTSRIQLRDIHACVVHPASFNRLTAQSENKATALSRVSLTLLGRAVEALPQDDGERLYAVAVCDKHGGRNHYASLLMEAFSDTLIQVDRESRAVSRYRVRMKATDADISFQCGGEAFLPTALASMTAKYVREISMRALNDYWRQRVDGLRATAGYPVDSYRFKRDIASAQLELGIDDHLLWRSR